jgi:hypothetical protein
MNELTKLNRENGRLKMRLDLLQRKLYQVCLSHDHLSACLNRANVPMSFVDRTMMQTTKKIMTAFTTEEVETIYNEASGIILGKNNPNRSKKQIIKQVFFFGDHEKKDLGEDLIAEIEKMIADIDEQIKNLSDEDKKLYEQGLEEEILDDRDLPEDPLDENDLKPPF